MYPFLKQAVLSATLAASMMATAGPARAEESSNWTEEGSAPAIIGDLLLARPAGLVATVAGTAVLIVAWPFALLSDSTDAIAQKLVIEPVNYTFARPLGKDL